MFAMVFGFLHRFFLRTRIAGAWSARFVSRAFTSLFAGAVALGALVALGVALGRIGYGYEADWLIEIGQVLIAIGGMIAVCVLGVFYLKAVLGTHALALLSDILGAVSFGRVRNVFAKETGREIRHDFLNAFAWVAAFCVYCLIIPVYKTLLTVPIGVILAFFFAFASAKSWTFIEKPIGKIVVFSILALAFVLNIFNGFTAGAMAKWTSQKGDVFAAHLDSWTSADEGREDILEERASYEEARAKVRVAEYRRLRSRQIALASHGKGSSDEFKRNAVRMRELERGRSPVKVVEQTAAGTVNAHPVTAAPVILTVGADKLTGWISSHWGWILIWTLVVFLLILFFVGLATRQRWLAATALAGILLLGFLGAGSWIMGHTRVHHAAPVVLTVGSGRHTGVVHNYGRAKCRPGLHAEIEDIGRNLDALAAQ